MQVKVDLFAILCGLLTNWAQDDLSWREPEGPLSSQMLRQNCRKAFDGSENGTVHNDWPTETRLELLFLPGVDLAITLIGREVLRV